MTPLLFLAHRIPYPPDKGDKIRSFHLLKALASRYRVYLGSFIDAPEDRRHLEALKEMCAEICVPELSPGPQKLLSIRGILQGRSLTEAYYWNRELAAWVQSIISSRNVNRAVVFSSSMGQFLPSAIADRMRCVIDFCDLDSEKWREYAIRKAWVSRAVYAREASRLRQVERSLTRRFSATLFVSDLEAATFCEREPDLAGKIHVVRNGVDAAYFDPDIGAEESRSVTSGVALSGPRDVVFTGAMDYWANVDGVCWFADVVWPQVIQRWPDARFGIVGARPSRAITGLASRPGIYVTGAVKDVRPYLLGARAAVAPLRVARGVQNKVLEAMAMARRVVASPAALQGIAAAIPEDVHAADTASDFAHAVCEALSQESAYSASNREYVLRHYDWSRSLKQFLDIVGEDGVSGAAAAQA